MDLRTNRKYFATSLTDSGFLTETEYVYCSVRTKYLSEIQFLVSVGKDIVRWGVLVGSCKGTKTRLDSANQLFNWPHGAQSFLGREYTPFTSIKLIPCIVEVQVPLLCSQNPTTGVSPKSDDLIQYTSCSSHILSNIFLNPRECLQNGLFPSVFHHKGVCINPQNCHMPGVFHLHWYAHPTCVC